VIPAPVLSPLDSIFLNVESDRTPMHIVSIAFFEAAPLLDERGGLRIEDLRQLISSRLELIPKLRRVARRAALREAPPTWADQANFDIANHVTRRRLAAPGSDEQLLALCAQVVSSPLDQDRPLWELTFVEGLESGQIALIEKLHHSMADGIAAAELALVLLDVSPECAVQPPEPEWRPDIPAPFVVNATRDLWRLGEIGVRVGAWAGWSALHPLRRARLWSTKLGAVAGMLNAGLLAPPSPLNQQIGAERQIRLVRLPLEDVRTVAHERGGTVNDVVLTLVTHGLRKMVGSDGWNNEETMNALVPVGLATGPNRGIANHVSALLVKLPVGSPDAEQTFETISAQTKRQKQQHQEIVADAGLRILEPLPQTALAGLSWLVEHQPFFNLIVTNVPGPNVPLYALGARMLHAFPLVPLIGNQGLGVAALSYLDQLNLGLLADPTVCADLDSFCEGIDEAFRGLVSAGQTSTNGGSADRQV
jgi:WS/DGAT/MGAT family acyltransferase